jgi:hypothetical protein
MPAAAQQLFVTAWTSCGSGNVCVGVNICMNNGALRAVKKLYIRLCAARDTLHAYGMIHAITLDGAPDGKLAHCDIYPLLMVDSGISTEYERDSPAVAAGLG